MVLINVCKIVLTFWDRGVTITAQRSEGVEIMNNTRKTFAYIRVSTEDQNIARQLDAIEPYNLVERDIYIDKVSGKDFNRPQYQALKTQLREGDLIIVKSIDRLGRNYSEIKNEWQDIVINKKVDIEVLDMPILNSMQENTVMSKLISDIVLQLLAFVAEQERDNIKTRQAEGIAKAKKDGIYLGRPKIDIPKNFETVVAQWEVADITATDAMKQLGLKRNTFYRLVKLKCTH